MAAERMRDCREGMRARRLPRCCGSWQIGLCTQDLASAKLSKLAGSRSQPGAKLNKARPRQVPFESVTGNPSPPTLLATASEWLLALMRNVCGPAEPEAVLVSMALL